MLGFQEQLDLLDLLDRQPITLAPCWREYYFGFLDSPTRANWEHLYLAPVGQSRSIWDVVVEKGFPIVRREGKFWRLTPAPQLVWDSLRQHELPSLVH